MSILVCVERPRRRSAERIAIDDPVNVSLDEVTDCQITDISETGAKIECDETDSEDTHSDEVKHEDTGNDEVNLVSASLGSLQGKIAWRKKQADGKISFGVVFLRYTTDIYKKLMRIIADRNKGYHNNKM